MSYRKRVDVIASILMAANPSAKKTQIMYQANLSYSLLTKYLTDVVSASLLGFENGGKSYLITEKGHLFLKTYEKYTEIREIARSHLHEVHSVRKTLNEMCPSYRPNDLTVT